MTRNHIEDLVAEFNEQITLYNPPDRPSYFVEKLVRLRAMQMYEELQEVLDSTNLVDTVDGLMDFIYFAVGTLHLMGIHRELFNELFQTIHDGNMKKKAGIKTTRTVQGLALEDHPRDAIKPDGWEPPEKKLAMIMGVHYDG